MVTQNNASNLGHRIALVLLSCGMLLSSKALATTTPAQVFSTLAPAGPAKWSLLEVGAGTTSFHQDLNIMADVSGNIGITNYGTFESDSSKITGDLYLGDHSASQFTGSVSGNKPVTGKTHMGTSATTTGSYTFTKVSDSPQTTLTAARTAALSASSLASSLTATSSLTQINLTNTTLSLNPGVYNLSQLNLSHSTLTLSGSGYFVFNITSKFTLNTAKILLANGATESNVLFNYVGTQTMTMTGGTSGSSQSVLHGILLALNGQVSISPGLVVGEIISAKNMTIGCGSIIQNCPPPSVPDSGSTAGLGILALGGMIGLHAVSRRLRPISLR